ncbi:hypothetical protein SRO_7438 [Streptomyces rochei]|nr:hypothetical protein SRO_7438 [Streptomyces rochei]
MGRWTTRLDRQACPRRDTGERCLSRLKGLRSTMTRCEETAASYEAAIALAGFPALGKVSPKTDPGLR